MPFENVLTARQPTRADVPLVVGIYNGGNAGPRLALALSQTLFKDLGWSRQDRIEILEGTGRDQGFLQLRPIVGLERGVAVQHPSGKGRHVIKTVLSNFKHQTGFPITPRDSVEATCQTFGSALTLLLPDWGSDAAPA